MAVRDKLAEAGISDNRILANFGRKEIPQKFHPKVDLTKVNERLLKYDVLFTQLFFVS